ncbi:MAG: methyltransferase domain-containing protein [Coriobacteriia bacterium]|nr:methyltransferase domain-containing protein [Coriobacteriia bacterium]
MGVTAPLAASREIARATLSVVREREAYFAEAFSATLERTPHVERDIGYAARLARMSVGTFTAISPLLNSFLERPDKLPTHAFDCLAVSATELLYTDTDTYAVVSQGVELMRSHYPHLASLANAVLRRVVNEAPTWLDAPDLMPVERLARRYGFPGWLASMFDAEQGYEEAEAILRASNEEPPVFVHVLSVAPDDWRAQLEVAGARVEETDVAYAYRIEHFGHVRTHPLVMSRAVLVTDLAVSRLIEQLDGDPRTILDVCCGRGTKSLLLADRARRRGMHAQVIAVDNGAHKIERARADAAALGYDEVTFHHADIIDLNPEDIPFDASDAAALIFIDAPCSGLGTLRRHPDKRLRLQPDDIDRLVALQSAIVSAAARFATGGTTVAYATCTISERENDGVVGRFLADVAGDTFTRTNTVRTRLGEHGQDGHIMTLMERKG